MTSSKREAQSLSRAEFTHRTLVVIGLVVLAAVLATTAVLAADVFLVFFGGILLAVFIDGLADLLSRHVPLAQRAAVVVVVAVMFLTAAIGAWLLAAELSSQISQLGGSLTQLAHELHDRLQREPWGRQLLSLFRRAQDSGSAVENAGASVASGLSTTLGGIANAFIVLFIGIYLAINPGWYRRGLLRLIPPARRNEARDILTDMGHSLRWWLFGRAVGMSVVGVITGLGLWLLHVPFALGLGLIAAIFDFVPFVGPIAAAAPALLVAAAGGTQQVVSVALMYGAIQLFEGYILTPLIEQRSVKLPPALTIATQVVLGVLVGALGVVLATPVLAVIVLLIKRLYVEETLESATG